jgi:hypothetical protein
MPITAFEQVANNAQSTLAEDLTNVETDIDVASGHGSRFPATGNGYYLTIWDADTYADPFLDPSMEIVRVTARSSDTLTVTRGQRGTSGVTHTTGHAIRMLVDSELISDLQTATNNIEKWAGPYGFRQWTDCIEKPEQSHWQPRVSGGSVAISTNAAATAGRPGVWDIATAGGTTDWASITLGDFAVGAHILLGGGTWALEAVLYLPNLSDAGQEYDCRFGLGDLQGGDHANGVYFEYDRNGSVNWRMCAANASTYTRTATSTAVAAATWVRLRIEVNAAASSAEFFINGVSVGTVATNIPTANRVYPILHFVKSAGGTTRRVFVDCLDVHHVLTTAR